MPRPSKDREPLPEGWQARPRLARRIELDQQAPEWQRVIAVNFWAALLDAGFRTQSEAARAIGVSQATINRWLTGEIHPVPKHFEKISRVTGKSRDWFHRDHGYLTQDWTPPSIHGIEVDLDE